MPTQLHLFCVILPNLRVSSLADFYFIIFFTRRTHIGTLSAPNIRFVTEHSSRVAAKKGLRQVKARQSKVKRKPHLTKEIALVLCCKLAFIFALWFIFFGPEKRIDQTPENVAAAVLDRAIVQKSLQHE